jgi:S-DNA-T family DNA segregation ATPase FtsK/SpoIIIE
MDAFVETQVVAGGYPQGAARTRRTVGDRPQNRAMSGDRHPNENRHPNGNSTVGGRLTSGEARVRLRLTVVDPSRAGATADVLVTAPQGALSAAVRDQLLLAVGAARAGLTGAVGGGLHVDGDPAVATVLGLPPLLDGATLTVGRPGGGHGRAAGTAGGLLEVHSVAGPAAGSRVPLPLGETRIGRCAEVGVRLEDPDVSRVHAALVNTGGRVEVTDLGSTNGTTLDGAPVRATPCEVVPGSAVRVGGSTLVLRAADGAAGGGGGPASTHPDGRGHLLVNTVPRLLPPAPGGRIEFPAPPTAPTPGKLSWAVMLLPLLLTLPIAWWLRQPTLLAFGLLSPLMMAAHQLSERRGARAQHVRATAEFEQRRTARARELDVLLRAEADRLRLDHPDLAAVAAVAAGPLQRLWERRRGDPDHLLLRLGLGETASRITVSGPAPGPVPPALGHVPIPVDLGRLGIIGVAGPRAAALALAHGLLGQAATWHSPRELRIVVLSSGAGAGRSATDWGWTAWLPHADGALPEPAEEPGARPPAAMLLVLDGAERLRRDPRVARLLGPGRPSTLYVVCLDEHPARLPSDCAATAVLDGRGGGVLAVRGDRHVEFSPDLVAPGWAARLGRDLARLADATPSSDDAGLPDQVRLLDLLSGSASSGGLGSGGGLGCDAVDPRQLASGWAARLTTHPPETSAPIGVTRAGPWSLDLRRDGPHILVAGTTGAGKSEMLTTLVAGLATRYPPQTLNFLLVDYKGGTAFGALCDLPHVTGMITDLDAHLAGRALSSLRAELRRRESLLRAVGAADLEAYEQLPAPAEPAPARLVIVVDEFRVLAEELPGVLSGLVRVAAVGRSLGVHLVLATQRPAGAVSADIRANVNLRIALRVRDRADSDDVVDAPDAAQLPADRPGRGLYRVGGGPLVAFQAARCTGGSQEGDLRATVQPLRIDRGCPSALVPHSADAPSTSAARSAGDDLSRLVGAITQAAAMIDSGPARPPWLPPLPTTVTAVHLADAGPVDLPAASAVRPGTAVTFGLLDLPDTQSRGLLRWDLAAQGHLAIVGAPGSGRTGCLRAVAAALARGRLPVHVHVIDGGGRLSDLAQVHRVGTVVPATDTERVGRLLSHLRVHAREGSRPTVGALGAEPDLPRTVLLIDGWEQVLDAWYPVEHGRLVDELLRLARGGAGSGVSIAITGGRNVLSGAIAGLLTERLLLRAADPTDLIVAGVSAADLPSEMPPGRAVRLLPGGRVVEAQVAWENPATDPSCRTRDGAHGALRLRPLPDHLPLSQLLPDSRSVQGAGLLPIGWGGDDPVPVGPATSGAGWLVAGTPGSGRSSAQAVAGRILLAAGRRVVALGDAPSPVAGLEAHGAIVVPVRAARWSEQLIAALDRWPSATLIVDELSALIGTPVEDLLTERLDRMERRSDGPDRAGVSPAWPAGPGPHVIAGTCAADAALAFRGLLVRLRAGRSGLLTGAIGPVDAEAFGVRVPPRPAGPPGRAVLVRPGGAITVQLADPLC